MNLMDYYHYKVGTYLLVRLQKSSNIYICYISNTNLDVFYSYLMWNIINYDFMKIELCIPNGPELDF